MSTQFGGSEASVTEPMENTDNTTGTVNTANTGDNMTRVYHSRSVVGGRRPFRTAGRIRPEGVSVAPQVGVVNTEAAVEQLAEQAVEAVQEQVQTEAAETVQPIQQTAPQSQPAVQPIQQAAPQPQPEVQPIQQAAPQPQPAVQPIQQAAPQPQPAVQPIQQAVTQMSAPQPMSAADPLESDLINRIDEFNNQAQVLQNMIAAHEAQARELEAKVEEQRVRNQQLQNDYAARQSNAMGIANGMEDQLDQMIETLRLDMEDMEQSINSNTAARVAQSIQQTEGLKASIEEIKQQLSAPLDNGAIMDALEDIKKSVAASGDVDLKESFEELTKVITTSKNEITDSVHTENVKVYRNIQDLIKEDKSGEELELSLEVWYRILKRRLSVTMTVMIINMGLAVVLILAILGVL